MDITQTLSEPDENGLQLFSDFHSGYMGGKIDNETFNIGFSISPAYSKNNSKKLTNAIKKALAKTETERNEVEDINHQHLLQIQQKAATLVDDWKALSSNMFVTEVANRLNAVELPGNSNNQWEPVPPYTDETMSISNCLYSMHIRMDVFSDKIAVSYSVILRGPEFSDDNPRYEYLANVNRKIFHNRYVAERYIKGRKKAYAKYFQEENPVVPNEYRAMFQLYGVDIPCYRYAS